MERAAPAVRYEFATRREMHMRAGWAATILAFVMAIIGIV